MTYSCTDFADDMIAALKLNIPDESDDSPSDQAELAVAEIERLQRIETAALERPTPAAALVSTIARMTPYAGDNVDTLDAVETVNSLIAAALAIPVAPAPEAVWLDRAAGLLTETLNAWEGEEDSVQEEHSEHIDSLKAFFAELIAHAPPSAAPVAPAPAPSAGLDLDNVETAIVLAGLRMIQRMGVHQQENDIATDGGEFDALDDDAIDALCEKVNR